MIVTGALNDGTAGLRAVKASGGTAIVQRPEDAVAPSMPLSALKHVALDHCVPLKAIAPLLAQLTLAPATKGREQPALPLPQGTRRFTGDAAGRRDGTARTEEAGWSALRSREAIVLRRPRWATHRPEHPHDEAMGRIVEAGTRSPAKGKPRFGC